jgi:hypothetical protein
VGAERSKAFGSFQSGRLNYLHHSEFHDLGQTVLGKSDLLWRRWLSVTLRSLHLAAVVLAGVAIFGSSAPSVAGFILMLLTGFALTGIELWHHPTLWRDVAGVFIAIKLPLMLAMLLVPAMAEPLFWFLLVSSAIVSHAPREFRRRKIIG